MTCFKLQIVLGAGVILLAGCVSDFEAVTAPRAGATAADRREPSAAERDRVLVDYRTAAVALRAGDYDTAKAKLDDAIARIGGIITNDAAAARARTLFAAESTKVFIGEPYERVMAYYYRGILYWRDGQLDNARACFRTAALIDSDPENEKFETDYVLLDFLDGFASTKLGADGSDAIKRAQVRAVDQSMLPTPDRPTNVLVFFEYGYGPRKYAAGQFREQLRFQVDDSPTRSARLVFDRGQRTLLLPGWDDLCYQATTRGGRVMDHILGNKAVFKAGTDLAGDVALAGSAYAADEARRRKREGKDEDNAERTAIGLGVLGLIGKVASAATQTQADVRQWDNLPQHIGFAALQLPPGEHHATLEFLDRDGVVLERRTQPVTISVGTGDRDTIVFLSELKQ